MLKRRLAFLIAGILFTVLLSGCLGNIKSNEKGNDVLQNNPLNEANLSPTPAESEDGPKPVVHDELLIYTLSSDTYEIIQVVSSVSEKNMSLNSLAGKIEDALEDETFVIKIKEINIEKGNAVVNFETNGTPLVEKEEVEKQLLNCIAQSILDNVSGVNGIVFRIDGKAYVTQYVKLDVDFVYLHN